MLEEGLFSCDGYFMFGLDPATVSTAYILASLSVCPAAPAPPKVELLLTPAQPAIIENLGYRQINAMAMGKLDPKVQGALDAAVTVENTQWAILGLTTGVMQTKYGVGFALSKDPATQSTCLSVAEVRYEILYTPVVYIAADLLNRNCTHPVVLAHEQSHVAVDLRTIQDYLPTMKQNVENFVRTVGVRGPYAPTTAKAEQDRIGNLVMSASVPIWNQLTWLRRKRQNAIDTVENYKAEQGKCPGEWLPR
jgi:hypothetical protein